MGRGVGSGRCREGVGEMGNGEALLEQDAESLDQFGQPLGEMGEEAFLDLVALAVKLAQEGARGLAIGDGLDVQGYSVFSITVTNTTGKEN